MKPTSNTLAISVWQKTKNNLRHISSQANLQRCLWTNSYALRLCCSGKRQKQILSVMENSFLFLKRLVELNKEVFLDKIIGQDFNAKPIYICLSKLSCQDFRKRCNQKKKLILSSQRITQQYSFLILQTALGPCQIMRKVFQMCIT